MKKEQQQKNLSIRSIQDSSSGKVLVTPDKARQEKVTEESGLKTHR